MGGFAGIVRGALAGLNDAAGNTQTAQALQAKNQQEQQARQAQLRAQILPHALAIKGLQMKLQALDPQKDADQYAAITHDIARNLAEVRGIIYPDKDPKGNFFERGITDKLHLSSLKQREQQLKAKQAKGAAQDEGSASAIAQGTVPYTQQPDFLKAQSLEKQRIAAEPPEYKNFRLSDGSTATIDVRHQAIPVGAVMVGTSEGSLKVEAPKVLEASGTPYGITDPDTGKTFYASQMKDPNTPQNIRDTWSTVQSGIKAKQDEQDKKDEDRDKRFLETQAAIADRMGRSEEWQATMADYRERLGNYKTLDANANKTQTLADTYEAQYQDPNTNKSAVDTALLTDYTSVLAQGGRKTQAEIALARQIGSFKLNMEQRGEKFVTGELPKELRKMYLDYIKSAAKTQREDADKLRPDPPTVTVPEGPKTKKLKESRDPLGVL